MKKIFFMATATLALSVAASATTIVTVSCTQVAILGQSGSGTEVCTASGALPPAGVGPLLQVDLNAFVDFQFNNLNAGTKSILASIDSPGTGLDVSSALVNQSNRALNVILSTTNALDLAFYGSSPWNAADSFTGASTAVTGATFDKEYTLTYADLPGGAVPEPATYAMIGLGLSALAFARRKA